MVRGLEHFVDIFPYRHIVGRLHLRPSRRVKNQRGNSSERVCYTYHAGDAGVLTYHTGDTAVLSYHTCDTAILVKGYQA